MNSNKGSGNPPSLGRKVKRVNIFVALSIREVEQKRERRKINFRTRVYLFIKASRFVSRGVRLREEPLT